MIRKLGFTLMEMIVSMALGILVLGVLVTLFFHFRGESEEPLASMDMEQSTLYLMSYLQRELSETNLQSIRSLPNESGVALESARDDKDALSFSAFGTVLWKKFVYFQVKPITPPVALPAKVTVGSAQVTPGQGEMDYDDDTSGVGVEPGKPGAAPSSSSHHRVLAHNFFIDTTSHQMGCNVYFPDDAGNPHAFTDTERGEPVCVAITLLDVSSRTGQPTVRKLFMQVKPKN